MSRLHRGFSLSVVLLLSVLTVTACASSPPSELNNTANNVPKHVTATVDLLNANKKKYEDSLADPKYSFTKEYSAQDRHADRFDLAKVKADEALQKYNQKIKPVLDDYKDERKAELETAVAEANKLNDEAKALANDALLWLDKLVEVRNNARAVAQSGALQANQTSAAYESLAKDVTNAKQAYSKHAEAIDKQLQPLTTLHSEIDVANKSLQQALSAVTPNYAVMATQADIVQVKSQTFTKDSGNFNSKLVQLNERETKTLLDVQVLSTIKIVRSTWNDDDEGERTFTYPAVGVDLGTANYFANLKADIKLAETVKDGDFKTAPEVDRGQWDKLRINPWEQWPEKDKNGQFYLAEINDTYCNKLLVLKNGRPNGADRPLADHNPCKFDEPTNSNAGMYWAPSDVLRVADVGMDIYVKGLGDFDDQAIITATPPGLLYAGDSQFGSWQTDSKGQQIWIFGPSHKVFSDWISGPSPYHYRWELDEWNKYYRYKGQPFYGNEKGKPRYGMNAPLAERRYAGTKFVETGLFKASLEGKGPLARS